MGLVKTDIFILPSVLPSRPLELTSCHARKLGKLKTSNSSGVLHSV